MNQIRILHLTHRFWPCLGGVETNVRQLCENLAAKGHSASVACLNKCPKSREKLPAKEELNGIQINRLGFLDTGFYRIAPGIIKQVREYDVIHVHGLGFFSDFLAKTKFLHRKKLVLSTHGGIFHTGKGSFLKRAYFFGWNRLALKAFDKVIAVSRHDLELFKKIVPKEKIVLIENPIDTDRFKAIARNAGQNSFLFVGRLSKNKGLLNLLEAFSLLKKAGQEFSLTIAGKEFDLNQELLREKTRELGISANVKIPGEISDKRLLQLYSQNEFFVSASEYEGFGISAVEAMAAGLIPVLNGIPAFRAFVRDGKNGFITDYSNPEKASRAIARAASMPAANKESASQAARQFAQGLSWEKGIEKFERVYREALG